MLVEFFATLLIASSPTTASSQVEWGKIADRFSEYSVLPTPENADRLLAVLPTTDVASWPSDGTMDRIYTGENLGMLERQVISRDPIAVRLALRLRNISDGGFAEDLGVILGMLIRIDPELFLTELRNAKPPVKYVEPLVANEGELFVDKQEAQCHENRLRRRAVHSVKSKNLAAMRSKVVAALDDSFTRYCTEKP